MIKLREIAALSFLIFVLAVANYAQTAGTTLMSLSEVKAGARGVAKTVFQGTRPEEFGVEILGIVPDAIGPRQDLIIGRLSGSNAMRTQVFAGMSGSPVYIDGKLVGAISYSFPWSKEPICGITPIEQMISIFADQRSSASVPSRPFIVSASTLTSATAEIEIPVNLRGPAIVSGAEGSSLSPFAGSKMTPISLPFTFSGISQSTLDRFASTFAAAGIVSTTGVASSSGRDLAPIKKADEKTLLGGDSVVMQLARGDISIAAAGTVTHRDGNKIYAFGHPFFSLGSTNVPMNESHVVVVVPSVNNSFKMAVADAMVGSLRQDRATGVYGILGESPKMLPVSMTVKTSRGQRQEVKFESAIDEFLTPLIINIGGQNTLGANERTVGESTIDVDATLKIKGQESLRITRRVSGGQAVALAAASVALPVQTLLRANFAGLEVENLSVSFDASEGSSSAVIERISTDRGRVAAGGNVGLTIHSRTSAGELIRRDISVQVPSDTPAGTLTVTVSDGTKAQESSAIQNFVAKSASELISILNSAKRPDRLYVVLTRNAAGVISGSSELTELPPSMLATINNDRSAGGPKELKTKVVSEMMLDANDYVTTGSQAITIEVVR